MIEKRLEELCSLFDTELERQHDVLALCRSQGEAARTHDVECLNAKTMALEILFRDSLEAEPERHRLLHEVVAYYDLPREKQTLTDLIAVAPEPWRRRLGEFQSGLRSTLDEIRRAVRGNAGIMRRSLRRINLFLRLLGGPDEGRANDYDARGSEPAPSSLRPVVIDQRG